MINALIQDTRLTCVVDRETASLRLYCFRLAGVHTPPSILHYNIPRLVLFKCALDKGKYSNFNQFHLKKSLQNNKC